MAPNTARHRSANGNCRIQDFVLEHNDAASGTAATTGFDVPVSIVYSNGSQPVVRVPLRVSFGLVGGGAKIILVMAENTK
jgi:hypothetical protein